MLSLYFALIGLLVGLVLDALIVRLAVAPDDEDDDGLDEAPPSIYSGFDTVSPARSRGSVRAEVGALVVTATPAQEWARRLVIVGATAALFAAVAARYDDASHLAVVSAYVCVLLVCAGTDVLSYRVPNVVTYPAMIGALVVGVAMPGANIWEVLAGGALAGGVLLLPAIITSGVGMGMGDVKLVAFSGLALGFTKLAPALVFMALGGGAVALLLLVSRLRKRGEPIPYAPFISIGVLATLIWQGAAFVRLT